MICSRQRREPSIIAYPPPCIVAVMDGERKLYREDLAALAGIKTDSLNKIRKPDPDGRDIDGGHARPWWWESTAKAWIEARPGRGWRRGQHSVT